MRAAVSHAGFGVALVLGELVTVAQEWQTVEWTENIVISSWD